MTMHNNWQYTKIMETRSKVSGGSEPLKMAIWAAKRQSGDQNVFLHARHRATNMKLGLRSLNAISPKTPLVCTYLGTDFWYEKRNTQRETVHGSEIRKIRA